MTQTSGPGLPPFCLFREARQKEAGSDKSRAPTWDKDIVVSAGQSQSFLFFYIFFFSSLHTSSLSFVPGLQKNGYIFKEQRLWSVPHPASCLCRLAQGHCGRDSG